jgi:hypothetical protein
MSDGMPKVHGPQYAGFGLPSYIRTRSDWGESEINTKGKPCISVKFPGFVDAKNEKHILAGAICLIQNLLVVLLCGPDTPLNTEV